MSHRVLLLLLLIKYDISVFNFNSPKRNFARKYMEVLNCLCTRRKSRKVAFINKYTRTFSKLSR